MEILIDIIFTLGSILIGLWLADFASGCFHWVVDGYCDPTWPIIGPAYILPAHLHHDEGKYEFEMASIVTHLYIWSAVLVTGMIFWALGLMSLTIASACFFGVLTNIIHRWSHTRPEDNTAIVRALQRAGLFQSPHHHTFHHQEGADHFCLLTDHVNPLLEWAGLWRHLDKFMSRIGIPKNWWETPKEA